MANYSRPKKLSQYAPAALAMGGAALICLGAASVAVDKIEDQSLVDVQRVLSVDGQDWVDVVVDGLVVRLQGQAPDEATRFRALTVAGSAVDAARIIDTMDVRVPDPIAPPRFSIEILRNEDGVALFGLIPERSDRDGLIERARELAGSGTVTDLMETADFDPPLNWAAAVNFSLDALDELPRSKISVAADKITVTATTESAQIQRRTETTLTRLAPNGVDVTLNLSAPRPVIAPFTLRFIIDEDGPRFDACSADTDESRNRIIQAARDAGLNSAAICTVGMGVPSTSWGNAAEQAIAALGQLGKGTVTFSNADITLVAADDTPQELFDEVIGKLENSLPDVFSLHSVLPEPVQIDGTGDSDTTPEFVATKSPEGLVQLRGRITDARSRAAVESFAKARFGAEQVRPATRLDDGLPEGWPLRVLAGLESLSLLNNGALVVQQDYLELRGVTGREDAPAEISRLLSDRLGEGSDFALDITYEASLDPLAGLPTPKECANNINAILAEQKITFAPGSSDIESDANDIIDRIADVMRECQTVTMEIGGHTDSQGRESMNLSLSQARADAVLNAIMARRVLTSNLTAKGYGETKPIASNDSDVGREANRRIEFVLKTTGETAEDPAAEPDVPDETAAPDADDQSAEEAPAEDGPATDTTEDSQ